MESASLFGQLAPAASACKSCASRKSRPISGAYNFRCPDCCAHLVWKAHPDKRQAAAMLAAIARFEHAPARELVLARVSEILALRAGRKPAHAEG